MANDTVVVVWKENHRRPDSHSETWKQSALRIIKQGKALRKNKSNFNFFHCNDKVMMLWFLHVGI